MNVFAITLIILQMLTSPSQILAPPPEHTEPYILQEEIPVLMYHEIGTPAGPWKELYVEPPTFTKHLSWLKDNNYTTVSLQAIYDHWYNQEPLPEKPIVLSFDDGYRNMYDKVLPLLLEYNMQATFFLYPSKFNTAYGLTNEMVLELAEKGMEISSHTYSHQDLTKLSAIQAEKELASSKKILEEITKKPVNFLCYPSGRYNSQVIQLSQKYYQGAVTTKYGLATFNQDRYQLKRIRINYSDGLNGFINKLTK